MISSIIFFYFSEFQSNRKDTKHNNITMWRGQKKVLEKKIGIFELMKKKRNKKSSLFFNEVMYGVVLPDF